MGKRKSITKKVRFDVFKRDDFTCIYCGNSPPKIVLEIDHVNPVSNGGSNDIDNLVTSCFDCNRGKGSSHLENIPQKLEEKAAILKEKEDQINEYEKALKVKDRRLSKQTKEIEKVFMSWFETKSFTDSFKYSIKSIFLKELPLSEIKDAMNLACSKMDNPEDAVRYFCGICWNKIKG